VFATIKGDNERRSNDVGCLLARTVVPVDRVRVGCRRVLLLAPARLAWLARRVGEAVLGERYARGEITEDEYRERLRVLRDAGRRGR
jgi:hypothetical protein